MSARRIPAPAVAAQPVAFAIVHRDVLRMALRVPEVAELLFGQADAATTKSVRALIHSGQLGAVSTGARWVIPVNALLAYLQINQVDGRSAA